jgi:hypothetical protein
MPSRFARELNPSEKEYVADAVDALNAVLMIPLAVELCPAAKDLLPLVVHAAPKTADEYPDALLPNPPPMNEYS